MDFNTIDTRKYSMFILFLLILTVTFPSLLFSSGIIIKRNEIYANNMVGIRNIGSKVVIHDTQIYSNGRAGVLIQDGTDDTLIDQCVIAYNNKTGVDINNSGKTSITSSSIHHNSTAGIQIATIETDSNSIIRGTCYVDIRESHIYKNDKSGIRGGFSDTVEHTLVVAVSDCNIEKNKQSGISIKNSSTLIASGNKISLNGMAGITSVEVGNELEKIIPRIDIVKNIIYENDNCGINAQYATTNTKGIRNNLILNNGNSGIRCQSTPMVIANNTIVGNGNKYQGVGIEHLDEQKAPYIINNIIAYNHITGIKIPNCKGYSYNLYYNNGGSENCCNNCYDAPYSLENKQVGGCERGTSDLICIPLFTAPQKRDYSLTKHSPAIDAGCKDEEFEDRQFPPSQGTRRNDCGITGGPYAIDPSVIDSSVISSAANQKQ